MKTRVLNEEIKEARGEYNKGNYLNAQQILETAHEHFHVTNNSIFSFNLGKTYAALGNKKAFECFTDALEIEGGSSEFSVDIYRERAKFYFKLGKFSQAKKDYEKIKSNLHENDTYHYAVILYHENREQYENFVIEKIDKSKYEALADIFIPYNKLAAIDLYEKLPEDIRVYEKLSDIYAGINEYKAQEYSTKKKEIKESYNSLQEQLQEIGWSKEQLLQLSDKINQSLISSLDKVLKAKISPDFKMGTTTAFEIMLSTKNLDKSISEIKKQKSKSIQELKEEIITLNSSIGLEPIFSKLEKIEERYNKYSLYVTTNKFIKEWDKSDISKWATKARSMYSQIDLEETLAVIKRAVSLHEGYEPRDIQILSVLSILESQKGRLADIKTGEGKSITTAMLAIIKALKFGQVDLITSSEVLAKRDAQEKADLYEMFGLSSSHNFLLESQNYEDRLKQKNAIYQKNIVYGTVSQFQFDMLTDVRTSGFFGNRPNKVVIVDEVDSMLIDGKNSQARLSSETPGMLTFNQVLDYIWIFFNNQENVPLNELTNSCNNYIYDLLHEGKISLSADETEYMKNHLDSWIQSAFIAVNHKKENQDYIVESGKIKIVDYQNTGVIQESTQWGEGIHHFLELKHGLEPSNLTLVTEYMSNVSFFQKYGPNIYGLTGTIGSKAEQDFLAKLYGIDFVFIPTYKYNKFIRNNDIISTNENEWLQQIVKHGQEVLDTSRSLLIISESIQKALMIFEALNTKGLSSKLYTKEGEFNPSTETLEKKQIIVSTNLAGRGTDIKTSDELELNGGMDVVVTFLPSNLRVEAQAFGRTARKGNQGSGKLIINLDDLYHEHFKLLALHHGIKSVQQLRDLIEEKKVEGYYEEVKKIIKKDRLYVDFSNQFLKGKNIHDPSLSETLYKWGIFLDKIDYQYSEESVDKEFKILKDALQSIKIENPYIALPETINMIVNDKATQVIEKIQTINTNNSKIEPIIKFVNAIALNKNGQFNEAARMAQDAIKNIEINCDNDQLRASLIQTINPQTLSTIDHRILQVQNMMLEPLKTLEDKCKEKIKINVELMSLSDAGVSDQHVHILQENGFYILKISSQLPWGQITLAFVLNTGMLVGGAILAQFSGPIGAELAKELIKTGAGGCVDLVMTVISGQAKDFNFSSHLKQQATCLVVNMISNKALMEKSFSFAKSALKGKETFSSLGKQFIDGDKVKAFKDLATKTSMSKQCLEVVKNASKVAIKEVTKQGISPVLTFGVQKMFGPENQFEMYKKLVEDIEPELLNKIRNDQSTNTFISYLIISEQTAKTNDFVTDSTAKLYYLHFRHLNLDLNATQVAQSALNLISNSKIKSYENLISTGSQLLALPIIAQEVKPNIHRYTDFFLELIRKQNNEITQSSLKLVNSKHFSNHFKPLIESLIEDTSAQFKNKENIFEQRLKTLKQNQEQLEVADKALEQDKKNIEAETEKIKNFKLDNNVSDLSILNQLINSHNSMVNRVKEKIEIYNQNVQKQEEYHLNYKANAQKFNREYTEFETSKSVFKNQIEKIEVILNELNTRLVEQNILLSDKITFNVSNLNKIGNTVKVLFDEKYPEFNTLQQHISTALTKVANELSPLHTEHKNHFCNKSVEEIEKNILKKYFELVISKIINKGAEYVSQKMQAAYANIKKEALDKSQSSLSPKEQVIVTEEKDSILLDKKLEDFLLSINSNSSLYINTMSLPLTQSLFQEQPINPFREEINIRVKDEIINLANCIYNSSLIGSSEIVDQVEM